jgi:hypothetical protein
VYAAELHRLHTHTVSKSVWHPTLSSVAWRIDVKATSKRGDSGSDNGEPTAILQLRVDGAKAAPHPNKNNINNNNGGGGGGTVQFELSAERVAAVVKQMATIESVIAAST